MTLESSPYDNLLQDQWHQKTLELIDAHPLDKKEIVEVILVCWKSIFESQIGSHHFAIGTHIFPKPQIMGFFLHELIPLELASRYPNFWRIDKTGNDKDLVYVPDTKYSVELKTSSHPSQIFGNRSYAQPAEISKKSKAGYYLAVNFQKFSETIITPKISGIRFGWLDHTDWVAQRAATGQQARLAPIVYQTKLLQLFP